MLGSMAVRQPTRSVSPASRASTGRATGPARPARWSVPPVLVRQVRDGTVESVHRGDIVEVDAAGRMLRLLGDPDRIVNLRSTVKPFGLVALLRAGGVEEFDLTSEEIAVMASSHSGEDVHVRTIQALYRRVGIPQGVLACGAEGMPLDALTAARLARDGERPSPLRHMCSGQHSAFILLAKLGGWELETYWREEHPAHQAYREGVAAVYDGVGAATLDGSLASLRPRGTLAVFGASSGPVPPFDLQRLNAGGSLFVTRPSNPAHPLPSGIVTSQAIS